MADENGSKRAANLLDKLIDKSTEQEHIPYFGAVVILLLWGTLSGVFLRGWALTLSLVLLGVIMLSLYIIYTKYGKKKKARTILFNEIIEYFKSNLDSKRYIESTRNPNIDVVGVEPKKDKVILVIRTNRNNHLKKNLVFDLIRIDKSKYSNRSFKFTTIFAYVKIFELGQNPQAQLIEVLPTEKKYYKDVLKQLKKNKTTSIKNWKIICHLDQEFTNASLQDLETTYNLLLKIRNAEG